MTEEQRDDRPLIYAIGIVVGLAVFVGPELADLVGGGDLDLGTLAVSGAIAVLVGVGAAKMFVELLHLFHRGEEE